MDLSKFAAMLARRELWFACAEVLAREDPYEAIYSGISLYHRQWKSAETVPPRILSDLANHYTGAPSPEDAFKWWYQATESMIANAPIDRRAFFVNCWHQSLHESVAMWKIYGAPGPGIAIVSSAPRVENALKAHDGALFMGSVRYIDPEIDVVPTGNVFNTVIVKRRQFLYESEVRIVHWDHGLVSDTERPVWDEVLMAYSRPEQPRNIVQGKPVQCDLDTLITEVIVSPYAPPWYGMTVDALVSSFGLGVPVRRSTLLDPPDR